MKSILLAAVLIIALPAITLAQTSAPAEPVTETAQAAMPAAKEETLRKLSRRERNLRIARLPGRHQDFLSDVEPIIQPAEIDTFLMLESEAQRDAAIDDFWRRRDAMHGTSNRAFRDMYYSRLDTAKEQFRKVGTDRAKVFLLQGPPAEVTRSECSGLLVPIEIWKYSYIKGVGQNIRLLFYRPRGQGEPKLWNPLGGAMAISDLLISGSTMRSADESGARRTTESASPYAYISRIQLECRDGEEIMRAITQMVQVRVDLLRIFEAPDLDEEEVRKILRSVVIANPDAPKLNPEFSVEFPTKDGSRTAVQMALMLPVKELSPAEVGGVEVYTIDVTGEVLRGGKLWEKYRYRFDFPGDFKGDALPIVIDRYLRPHDYVSRIKVTDANTGAEAVVEREISVPEVFLPPSRSSDDLEGGAAATIPAVAIADPDSAPAAVAVDPSLRLVPPPEEIVNGIKTVGTLIAGDRIKAVEFSLDGRRIAVRRAPPYSLAMDFGPVPRPRKVRAVGLDENDKPLTGDEIIVNAGTDPFRVRITSPRVAPRLVGPARIEMNLSIPEGDTLEGLELYWNEQRMATLYDSPFVQTIDIPATEGVGYIRAVAKLKDSTLSPVEDVVMINTPAYMEELDVHLIEVPVTVIVGGKPATNLTEKSFKLLDDGKPVSIAKFDYVKDLPLSIGLAIDTSGSMLQRIDQAQKAGAQFLQNIMKRGDKAFLVAFDAQAEVVQKWSSKLADLHAGLARLRAEETTALYDAVVYSLFNFHGIRGQKALVIISDGKDTASSYTFEEAIEYARRSSVPIYVIGIGIRSNEADVRYKLNRLATETGGTSYYIDQARDLHRTYDEIQAELRSQYILGFYPGADVRSGGKWRELTVQAHEGRVRTIKGYFP
ncbi:MAG TPA: VWA domain-containing protein [Thermoanaerobaculia bacterium]